VVILKKRPTVAWSDFALEHDRRKFIGNQKALISLIHRFWNFRQPGKGRKDLSEVVVVPMKIRYPDITVWFRANWIDIKSSKYITGKVVRRQNFEDPFVALKGKGKSLPVKFAKVVLYSATTLLQDGGTRSTDADWEIVAILTGPWENEPMSPLTMARNFLRKPGGTFAPYTAQQFAESIYFWSQFIQKRD
jgi:hypothetical protein